MRWDDFRRSDNIDDDRDSDGGYDVPSGGGFGIRGGGLGIGTIVVLGLVGWALGIDPGVLIGGAELVSNTATHYQQPHRQTASRTGAPSDPTGNFVAAIVGNTEDVWSDIFQRNGRSYKAPRLVLYRGVKRDGACGFASAAMGPFYCPRDQRIYLDTSFFRDMQVRFHGCSGKACEFAQAYVIAHEVGHHVQQLLGVLPKVTSAQRATSKAAANRLQVRVELQADCLAGVWAHHSDQRWNSLEPGDVNAALQTAAAIGDDRLQRQAQGYVVPDAFTHGTSAQRQRWFSRGLKDGKVSTCDTFSAASL